MKFIADIDYNKSIPLSPHRPYRNKKIPPPNKNRMRSDGGEGGTPERLAEAWRNSLISSLSFVRNKFAQRTLFHHKQKLPRREEKNRRAPLARKVVSEPNS